MIRHLLWARHNKSVFATMYRLLHLGGLKAIHTRPGTENIVNQHEVGERVPSEEIKCPRGGIGG